MLLLLHLSFGLPSRLEGASAAFKPIRSIKGGDFSDNRGNLPSSNSLRSHSVSIIGTIRRRVVEFPPSFSASFLDDKVRLAMNPAIKGSFGRVYADALK